MEGINECLLLNICTSLVFNISLFFSSQIIITTENVCLEMFEKKYILIDQLNLAIFNNCQKIILKDSSYFKVCIFFKVFEV